MPAAVFTAWVQSQSEVEVGEWFSIDGKSIKSSVIHYNQAKQNCVSLVSLAGSSASGDANGEQTDQQTGSRGRFVRSSRIE